MDSTKWMLGLLIAALVAGGVVFLRTSPSGPAAAEQTAQGPEYLGAEATAALNLPFSEAVRVGNILYLSGTIGTLPGRRELPPGGIQPETRQALENIRDRLQRYGSSLDRVIRCTIMLADMAEWGLMNEVYVTYFPGNKPARSAFGASGLALDARVEIECTAFVG